MKLRHHLIALLLAPVLALAQSTVIRNDSSAVVVNPSNLQGGSEAVDAYGNRPVIVVGGGSGGLNGAIFPVAGAVGLNGPMSAVNSYYVIGTDTIEAASTTTVLVLTAHVARIGDLIWPTGGTAGNIGVQIPVCAVATNSVTLCYPLPATPSTDAITILRPSPLFAPAEDSAHVSGDLGVQILGIRQDASSTLAGTAGDYIPLSLSSQGNARVNVTRIGQIANADDLLKAEDAGHTTADAGVQVFSVTLGTAQTASPAGSATEYAPMLTDVAGRLMINPWGQNTSNLLSACSDAETGTSDNEIAPAVASNRIYVTSISCDNDDATATAIAFKDGSTVVWRGAIGNLTLQGVGGYTHTFATPLRGTAATAFNYAPITTGSSVVCCASYFTSTL